MFCAIAGLLLATSDAILPNGVHLRAIPLEPNGVISIQAFVRLGSADDIKPGTAHLLEHMLFRRNPSLDVKAESAGGELSATTYREFMRFEFRGPKSGIAAGLECVESLISPPKIDANQLAVEKAVIAEERALRGANNASSTNARLWALGAAGTPYASTTMGDAGSVESLTSQELVDFYRKHFVGGAVCVVVSGDLVGSDTLALMKQRFAGLPKASAPALPRFKGSAAIETNAWAIPISGIDDAKKYAAVVALVDLAFREIGAGVTFEFGPSASGSLATVIAEEPAVPKLKAFFASDITDAEVKDALARAAKRFEAISDATQAGILNGVGLLFGIDDLPSRLAFAARASTTAEVVRLAGEWSKAIGK